MKSIIIVNKLRMKSLEDEVNRLLSFFCEYGESQIIDLGDGIPKEEAFGKIKGEEADLYVTVETAGFDMRMTGNALGFNLVPGRFFHIIYSKAEHYPELTERLNISHYIIEMSEKTEWCNRRKLLEEYLKEAQLP